MELLSEKPLCRRRHIFEGISENALFLRHHLWTQWLQDGGTERLIDADALLQGDDVVPVTHGLLLASTDECVDGCLGKAGRAIALRIDLQVQVGDGEVLLEFILTVHVNNLAENAHRATHVLRTFGGTLHGDTDDDLSAHLAGKIGRVIVFQATVYQHLVTDPYW